MEKQIYNPIEIWKGEKAGAHHFEGILRHVPIPPRNLQGICCDQHGYVSSEHLQRADMYIFVDRSCPPLQRLDRLGGTGTPLLAMLPVNAPG
jgi:hypothetical protein